MPGTPMRLILPRKGLYVRSAAAEQPPETTPSSRNARGMSCRTGRMQPSQRAGQSKFNTNALSGANPVREIVGVMKHDDRVTYTAKTSITNSDGMKWQTALPDNLDGIALVADRQGNTFTCAATSGGATGTSFIAKHNSAGDLVWSHSVPLEQATHFLRSIRLDEYEDVYVCLGGSGTNGKVYKYRQLPQDGGLVLLWTMSAPNGGMFADLTVSRGVLYAIENTGTYSYLHRMDAADSAAPMLTWGTGSIVARISADAEVAVACAITPSGACAVAICDTADPPAKNGFLRKYGPMKPGTISITAGNWTNASKTLTQTGRFAGAIIGQTISLTAGTTVSAGTYTIATVVSNDEVTLTTDINGASGDINDSSIVGTSTYDNPVWHYNDQGVGQAIVIKGGFLYSCGYGSGTPKYFTKLTDAGATVSLTADLGTAEAATIVVNKYKGTTSMDVDDAGVVYAAIGNTGSAVVLARIKADFSAADWIVDAGTTTKLASELYGVAVDPNHTDNGTKAQRIFVSGTPVSGFSNSALHGIDLLTITTVDGSPRSQVLLAACNGNIVKFSRGSGASSDPAGGTGVGMLSTSARWVMAAAGFNRVLWTDGKQYRSYNALTDAVSEWVAVGTGAIIPRARLLTIWNGRAWLAGFENEPQNWGMSEAGNFDGWDFFPVETTATQAVYGNSPSGAGLCPDIITALIAYSDDLAIVGCDHTIQRLTGDPAAGGRFDLMTDRTGIAFGRAFCKDEKGVLYFYGSLGGVYAMVPGTQPERISRGIDPLLKDIDVGATRIRLEWNDWEEGVHVFLTPYAGGATTHYFWSRERNEWEPDDFPEALDPTAVYVSDGDDADDRVLLLGGADGKVRFWDRSALTDDGTAIESFTFVGPVQAGAGEVETSIKRIRAVLGNDSHPMDFQTYGAPTPNFEDIGGGNVSGVGTWEAGRNGPVWEATRGQTIWVKVGRFEAATLATAGAWGLESIDAEVTALGPVRVRA